MSPYRIVSYLEVQYNTVTCTLRLEAATSYMPIAALALLYTSMAKTRRAGKE